MNRKGFTLIEIIICISMIVLIGGFSTIILLKNKKSSDIKKITNNIVQATSSYISIEKDDNGNSYENGIVNGAKALQLSVKNLLEKGYVSKETVSTLEKSTNKTSDKLYILASNSIKNNNDSECGSNLISYTANWVENQEPIYLCPYNLKSVNNSSELVTNIENSTVCQTDLLEKQKNARDRETHEKANYFCNTVTDYYYFIGNGVDNNYVSLGKNENGESIIWRIVSINKNTNKVKLAYNNKIEIGAFSIFEYKYNIDNDKNIRFVINDSDLKSLNGCHQFFQQNAEDYFEWNINKKMYLKFLYYSRQKYVEKSVCIDNSYLDLDSAEIGYNIYYSKSVDKNEFYNSTCTYKNGGTDSCKPRKINYYLGETDKLAFIYNHIYLQIFKPLEDFYNSTNLDSLGIISNEDFCYSYDNNHDCTAKINYKFGLLNIYDYRKISLSDGNAGGITSSYDPIIHFYNDNDFDHKRELTFDPSLYNQSYLKPVTDYSWRGSLGNSKNPVIKSYIRPSIILNLENIKVVSGNGSIDHPYIIEKK